MSKLFYLIIQIVLISVFSAQKKNNGDDRFEYYFQLNNKEARLSEFKDDDEALRIKLIQLDIINASRKKYKAKPVELDILASRVANKACKEAAENQYISHWNMAGEKPYHRYGFAGGCDHISENVFGEWTTGEYENKSATISDLMKEGHSSFMAERAPANGHKKNVIDKSHNFVGIGYYMTAGQFRYNEEFIDRYLEFGSIATQIVCGEKTSIIFRNEGKYFPYFLTIYRDELPQPLKPNQLNKKGSYNDYSNEQFMELPAWDIARYKRGNEYVIPLKFSKEGLYYVQIVTWNKEITSPAKLNTKGKTISSGIVIKVSK